jgi:hypothetical protein
MKKLLCFLLVAIVAVSGLSLRPNNVRAINTGTILVSDEYAPPGLGFDSPYFEAFKSLLISQGYSVIVSNLTITQNLLSGVNVLIVLVPTVQYSSSEIDQIQEFVSSGGGLFCIADHTTSWRVDDIIARWGFSQASGMVTDSDNYVGEYDYWVYYEAARGNFAEHPITDGLAKVQSACSNWFLDSLPSGAVSIITTDTDGTASPSGVSVYAALDTGRGRIVISMDGDYFGEQEIPEIGLDVADNAELGLNTIAWLMGARAVHDVAVLGATVSKTVVGEGYSVVVNVMVANFGDYSEVFDVTAYADESVIGMVLGVQLGPNGTLNLMLVWNSAEYVKGVYTVSVYASPVPGESDVDNNMRVAGNVLVTIPGDVNGDRKVGLKDIFAIALAFGSTTEGARYKPNIDINGDGKIDLKDYFIASKNFGQQW